MLLKYKNILIPSLLNLLYSIWAYSSTLLQASQQLNKNQNNNIYKAIITKYPKHKWVLY